VSTVDVNVLPGLDSPSGRTVARFLELGSGVPAEMRRLADQLGEGSAAPYERALAIEQFLSAHYQLVADGPSGHAYPNLSFFLFGQRYGGGQKGTTEQFAASFAVLGRILGIPTRVVLGFLARPDERTVRASDAFAWPEVLFNDVGWVPFNPLPAADTEPRPVEEDFKPPPPPSSVPPPSPVAPPSSIPPSSTSPGGDASAAPPSSGHDRTGLLLLGGLGVAVLFTGYVGAVPVLRRRLRRRRLSVGSPGERIAGAWHEVLDALRLAGRPAPDHFAVTEIAIHGSWAASPARHLRNAVPSAAAPLRDLAGLANAAAFGPAERTDEEADRSGDLALSYIGELREARPLWRRLAWALDPRPLWWSRHEEIRPF
jgi:hypothetical protein